MPGSGCCIFSTPIGLSDKAVVARWVENPYDQHFTGEAFFQHRPPINPSSLTRWRKRIGEDGAEWLLTKTIEAGRASGTVEDRSLSRVAVDTTVMEKTIALAYLLRAYCQLGRKLSITCFDEAYPVEVAGIGYAPLYDPQSLKPRS